MTTIKHLKNTSDVSGQQWSFAVSTKRNLYKEIKDCFGSNVFRKIGEIDLDTSWGACVTALEKCLLNSRDIVFSSPDFKNVLSAVHENDISENVKKHFVKEFVQELMSRSIIDSQKITVQKADIAEIFKELSVLINVAVHKHNNYVNEGEYGLVTRDEGFGMWSVKQPIQ